MSEAVLAVHGLTVEFPTYRDTIRALDRVSLSVAQGQVVGVVGTSGAGKSVLVDALVNLVRFPGRIVSGKVIFRGEDLLAKSDDSLRRIRGARIGVISTNPRAALHPMHRVGDQLAAVYRAHTSCTNETAYERAVTMLERVGINDAARRARSYPHELSGGMAKRVVIAMGLICEPEFLIADEPAGGLDVTIQAQILEDVRRLIRSQGVSALLITRDLGVVAHYCDAVTVLDAGRLVEDSAVERFFARPANEHGQRLLDAFRYATRDSRGDSLQLPRAPAPVARPNAAGCPTILSVRDLSKVFNVQGGHRIVAVDSVSFDLREGETVGLVGESGSGKTTLGRCILRLIEPTAGSVRLGETELTTLGERRLRRVRPLMQMVFQDPYNSLNPRRRVERVLDEPLRIWTPLSRVQRRRRVAELAEMVGLDPGRYLGRFPHEMTGGEQQRVAIARAIAVNPKLLVLDEVTSALDPNARASVIQLLKRLQAERGFSYLFISHDLTVVKALSQRVIVMYLGRVVEDGPAEYVFRHPRHPYTEALLGSVLWPEPAERGRISVLEGEIPSPIDLPRGCYFASRCRRQEAQCLGARPELVAIDDARRRVSCFVVQREATTQSAGTAHAETGGAPNSRGEGGANGTA